MATEGDQIWHGPSTWPLGLYGSIIKLTHSSFNVLSFVIGLYTWKKVGVLFEGFKPKDAN
jgi:hypothetical protein